jgi:hypothetical protein
MFDQGMTVTVIRQAKDRHGDPVAAAEHTVDWCAFAPAGSVEFTDNRDTVVTDSQLYAPAGSDITATDKVRLPDTTVWHVNGDPAPWINPWTGERLGIVVTLTKVTG